MAKLTFPGGIQLNGEKQLTKDAPFINLFPEGELVFPLSQHIGEPAVPVVKEGDFVRMGQVIARADGRLSAPIHAPVSGQITAVEDRLTADGTQARSIVLENDGLYLEIPYPPNRHIYSLRREEILAGMRSAGITGLGGASLPSAVKIEEADPESVDFCIANCMESEPYLTAGYRRLVESPWKVINGLRIVLRMFPKARGVIALPSGYTDCAAQLRELTAQMPHVQVRVLPDKYPQGAERQLIYAITGRTLNRTMLPHDIGCIVYNLDTLVAINQACITNEPLMTRTLTLSGRAGQLPRAARDELPGIPGAGRRPEGRIYGRGRSLPRRGTDDGAALRIPRRPGHQAHERPDLHPAARAPVRQDERLHPLRQMRGRVPEQADAVPAPQRSGKGKG